ncbi:hypothetical protein B0T22DRAFT_495106 [Podospora appendiculata]|uniref:Uncharacterized protein n=1 Tax=Podospora appendiculata TaxID=314037 RepID=A0AAE0WYX0_9PEZI|nr:hypothetical protein B0T22DRAFT_495106 [Podospora appendiculata]
MHSMSSSALFAGLLLVGSAVATPAVDKRASVCTQDNLYRCFTQSLSLASEYCTKSMFLPGSTETVTITPTVTSTSIVTVTGNAPPPALTPVKRAVTTSKPAQLGCLTGLVATSVFPSVRWTSACSCIGITAVKVSATVTGVAVTVPTTETSYVTSSSTSSSVSSAPPAVTSAPPADDDSDCDDDDEPSSSSTSSSATGCTPVTITVTLPQATVTVRRD